jgi:hypothetical protein
MDFKHCHLRRCLSDTLTASNRAIKQYLLSLPDSTSSDEWLPPLSPPSSPAAAAAVEPSHRAAELSRTALNHSAQLRRAELPPSRRAVKPSRRAKEPSSCQSSEPSSRRAAEPRSRRAVRAASRRAAEPPSRAAEPRSRRAVRATSRRAVKESSRRAEQRYRLAAAATTAEPPLRAAVEPPRHRRAATASLPPRYNIISPRHNPGSFTRHSMRRKVFSFNQILILSRARDVLFHGGTTCYAAELTQFLFPPIS